MFEYTTVKQISRYFNENPPEYEYNKSNVGPYYGYDAREGRAISYDNKEPKIHIIDFDMPFL